MNPHADHSLRATLSKLANGWMIVNNPSEQTVVLRRRGFDSFIEDRVFDILKQEDLIAFTADFHPDYEFKITAKGRAIAEDVA